MARVTVYINWRDKRQVNLISSVHNGSSFEKEVRCKPGEGNGGQPFKYIQEPKAIEFYTINMGGVDHADQKASYGLYLHRNLKWWKKAFFHMLQLAVVNAGVIYKAFHNPKRFDANKFSLLLAQ